MSSTNVIDSSALSQYLREPETTGTKKNQLGQEEFMELMLEQMKNQDPLKPTENGEFIAQMAQFSTVTGISEMSESLESLTASFGNYQALQSASLVGRNVLIPTDSFTLTEDNTLEGVVDMEASTGNASASIYKANGELVHQFDLGIQAAGQNKFSWDGMLEDGERAAPGEYSIMVSYGSGENTVAADVMIEQQIDSVNLSTSGGEIILNTIDGQSLNFSDVRQIH
ncbi:MAG: flagellar hook assembly protein FlgD [Gammaproteobacteria bacterium]|nr:flagellar hook assembly protein FlgD [Gammaproteobacteria bacterium]